tara:strand:+ start:2936 stop:4048 length:1113 start_codon:yes stop_codon:yes gene_type:complete
LKILTIVGARPQFIKAATISRVIAKNDDITEYILHTGQHYDDSMSEVFFKELNIPKPDINLNIGSGLHGEQTGHMLIGIEQAILKQKPDAVLVYGDTNSTLAGALAATKLHVPLYHIEAGLRSFNRKMPEELNRILTDHASDLLFAPTENAVKQLLLESIPEAKIILSGDIMFDAALFYGDKAERESKIIERLGLQNNEFILATVHRAENTDDPVILKKIIKELDSVAAKYRVVFPMHPRTRSKLSEFSINTKHIDIIEPIGYLDMVQLEKNAKLIVTDSGGVQKEAYFHKKPCITLRTETEWSELIEAGWNRLSPPLEMAKNPLLHDVEKALNQAKTASNKYLYGTGNSAQNIIKSIIHQHKKQAENFS